MIADDSWHHVVATYDNATIRLYVDGFLDSTKSIGRTTITVSSDLFIGRHFGTANVFFAGSLDEVVLYDRALSDIEVLELYQQTQ